MDDLQKVIIEFTKQTLRNGNENLGKILLSEFVEKFSLKADNEMGKLLVDWVSKIQLFPEDANKDSLSLMGLQYLLDKTYDTKKSFATYEIAILEYTLIKTKQIVLEENIDSIMDPYFMKYDSNSFERIKERLKPLLPFIDLRIVDAEDIVRKVEPLKLLPTEMLVYAYRQKVEKGLVEIQPMRGHMIFKWKSLDKEFNESWQSETKLRITNDGFTVEADSDLKRYRSVMGNLIIKGGGTHKWDILIEKLSETIYVGICCIGDQFDKPGDKGFYGWALGSDGYVYFKKDWKQNNAKFKEGDVVTVIVNMYTKHCYFGVNDVINYEVFGNSFPDEICPFVSLNKGSKVHVKSY